MRIFITTFILMTFTSGFAQQPYSYERKSISYLNTMLTTDSELNFSGGYADYFISSISDALLMERFDHNLLTGSLIERVQDDISAADNLTELTDILEGSVVGKIEAVLIENLEQRAAGYVSSEERASFAVTKAKTLGITVNEMEKVLNSAYIYFPVLEHYHENIDGEDESVIVTIRGSVLWYRVILVGDSNAHIEQVDETVSSTSIGFGSIEDSYSEEYAIEMAISQAYESAVDNFARNMRVATRKLPDFMLKGIVKEADWDGVSFNLGTREGISLNDRFLITRFVEDGDEVIEECSGFVEVTNVGYSGYGYENLTDSQGEFSKARIIRGMTIEEGMNVIEFPRLGLNLGFGLMSYNVRYESTPADRRYLINVSSSHSKPGFGGRISVNYNTAPITDVSNLFVLLEGGMGFVGIDAIGGDGEAVSPALYRTISGGAMKKLCFRSLSVPLKATFGLQMLDLEAGWPLFSGIWTENLHLQNVNLGFSFGTGLELALGPATSFSFDIDWRAYTGSGSWELMSTTHLDREDVEWLDAFPGPSVNASGLMIGISFVYMPPSLPFDIGNLIFNKFLR